MNYETVKSRSNAEEWVVEAIDRAGEGEIYGVCFYGPKAQERAEAYAAWIRQQESGGQS